MALLSIAAVDLYGFSIPFIRPMKVGSALLQRRQGLIISLTDREGKTGLGEVAPLPGLDKTNITQCRHELQAVKEKLLRLSVPLDVEHFSPSLFLKHCWRKLHKNRPRPPAPAPIENSASLLFPGVSALTLLGIESALFSLYLQSFLTGPPKFRPFLTDPLAIPVNGLFIPNQSAEENEKQILHLRQTGIKTVKVKIGRLPIREEISAIIMLCKEYGEALRLRLDGNQALSPESYRQYYTQLRHLDVEYAEEPLPTIDSAFPDCVPWPVALDESLTQYLTPLHSDPASLPAWAGNVILKPGAFPGLQGLADFIFRAEKLHKQTVLSSSFNTGVMLAILGAFWALVQPDSKTAHGFDTLSYLKEDILESSPTIAHGKLLIPLNIFSNGPNLRKPRLIKI